MQGCSCFAEIHLDTPVLPGTYCRYRQTNLSHRRSCGSSISRRHTGVRTPNTPSAQMNTAQKETRFVSEISVLGEPHAT